MYKLVQYLKFLLTATNQHGVHSPFVYNYVTKGLYVKTGFRYSKSVNVLLKSIDYFQIKQLWLPKNNEIKEVIQRNFPDIQFAEKEGELLWVSMKEAEKAITILSSEKSFQNDDILLIDAVHASEENYKVWKKVKMHSKVTVTVDMFFCGAVFFRKEQVKEHFKIRI